MTTVDLEAFEELIDGDEELRSQLIEMFFESVESCLYDLDIAYMSNNSSKWHDVLHAIKGTSVNIGAYDLSNLAAEFQDSGDADKSDRKQMLSNINKEYSLVKKFLTNL